MEQARVFHELFLDCVRRRGRVSELELMARYNLRLKKPCARLTLGWKLLRQGRLELWPFSRHSLKEIFSKLEEAP